MIDIERISQRNEIWEGDKNADFIFEADTKRDEFPFFISIKASTTTMTNPAFFLLNMNAPTIRAFFHLLVLLLLHLLSPK